MFTYSSYHISWGNLRVLVLVVVDVIFFIALEALGYKV